MKKGFTMIELIFVIVILGILASVAIPRLAATREDAEISAGIANLRTLLSDITTFYIAKGNFDGTKWKDVTNVPLKAVAPAGADIGPAIDATLDAIGGQTYLAVNGKNCLQIGMRNSNTSTFIAFKPVDANNNGACAKVLESDLVKPILDSTLAANGDPDRGMICAGVKNGAAGCIDITTNSIYETKVNNTGKQTQNP